MTRDNVQELTAPYLDPFTFFNFAFGKPNWFIYNADELEHYAALHPDLTVKARCEFQGHWQYLVEYPEMVEARGHAQ